MYFLKIPKSIFPLPFAAAAIILLCGVIAGILPAYRALQVKAIDAIREEN